METTLDKLILNTPGKVEKINCDASTKIRLQDLGIIPGTIITPVFSSIYGDPIAYQVRGSILAIRNDDSKNISISYLNF